MRKDEKTSVATLRPGVAESPGIPWRFESEQHGALNRNTMAASFGIRWRNQRNRHFTAPRRSGLLTNQPGCARS